MSFFKIKKFSFNQLNSDQRVNAQITQESLEKIAPFIKHSIVYACTCETVPTGAVEADGSAVKVDDYPNIFAEIGYNIGTGTTSEEFLLPDFSGHPTPTGIKWIMIES